MMMVKRYLFRYQRDRRTALVAPNCAGIISAGKAMLGIMPGHIYIPGKVGLVTRSGTLGYEAARFFREHMRKPVIGYVAGLSAPKGRRMGHAGAITRAFGESAAEKVEIMREACITVVPNPAELGSAVAKVLAGGTKRVAVAT